jgi:hypothetical protein
MCFIGKIKFYTIGYPATIFYLENVYLSITLPCII